MRGKKQVGGIGGGVEEPPPPGDDEELEPPEVESPAPEGDWDHLRADIELLRAENQALANELNNDRQSFNQLGGQMAQFERLIPQYNAALTEHGARIQVLGAQLARNSRTAALELAIRAAGDKLPIDEANKIVDAAAQFLAFIDPPEVTGFETAAETPAAPTQH